MIMHTTRRTLTKNKTESECQKLINCLACVREDALKLGAGFAANLIDVAVLALYEFDPNKPDSPPGKRTSPR